MRLMSLFSAKHLAIDVQRRQREANTVYTRDCVTWDGKAFGKIHRPTQDTDPE